MTTDNAAKTPITQWLPTKFLSGRWDKFRDMLQRGLGANQVPPPVPAAKVEAELPAPLPEQPAKPAAKVVPKTKVAPKPKAAPPVKVKPAAKVAPSTKAVAAPMPPHVTADELLGGLWDNFLPQNGPQRIAYADWLRWFDVGIQAVRDGKTEVVPPGGKQAVPLAEYIDRVLDLIPRLSAKARRDEVAAAKRARRAKAKRTKGKRSSLSRAA